ncbi:MAG: GNAT family N-acetyltransferase/peptidase C39 family protein [Halioglobus sp.]|nr:GNAT family N-acetyltransferase/peptidase C39 family protein [Halioglobus sp.]
MIRTATVDDLPQLLRLENTCFQTDRLSRRQFRYMLTRANAIVLADEENASLRGYVLILFSRGTSMARLYSIAVDPAARGCGVARALVEAAESESRERECAYLRLEVRKDNAASLGLFRAMGYRQFDERPDYYEDHMDAWRFEKSLAPNLAAELGQVAYYEQTLDFTCGPAALMMAMKSLAPQLALDRKLELRLWREATTIYMTSGHGGCGPFGLALAASRRGFVVEVYVSDEGVHLIDTVRSEEKKAVIRLVQEDMRDELLQCGVPIHYESLSLDELEKRFKAGGLPVVLISSYQIYEERFPHWVVVTGFDDHFVYANDPFVDYDNNETRVDSINMPIHKRNFQRMARYGRAGLRAVLMLYKGADAVGDSP